MTKEPEVNQPNEIPCITITMKKWSADVVISETTLSVAANTIKELKSLMDYSIKKSKELQKDDGKAKH